MKTWWVVSWKWFWRKCFQALQMLKILRKTYCIELKSHSSDIFFSCLPVSFGSSWRYFWSWYYGEILANHHRVTIMMEKKPDFCLWKSSVCESESSSVVSNSLRPHGLHSPWNSPGQNTGVGSLPFSRGSSQPRDWIQFSCIASRFFTSQTTREAHLLFSG